jgi:hypothetical protein
MVCAENFCSNPKGDGNDHCCAIPCTDDAGCSSSKGSDKTCTAGYCKIGNTGSLTSSSTTLLASVSALLAAATVAVSLVMLH